MCLWPRLLATKVERIESVLPLGYSPCPAKQEDRFRKSRRTGPKPADDYARHLPAASHLCCVLNDDHLPNHMPFFKPSNPALSVDFPDQQKPHTAGEHVGGTVNLRLDRDSDGKLEFESVTGKLRVMMVSLGCYVQALLQ
jgi:hypothetical protein